MMLDVEIRGVEIGMGSEWEGPGMMEVVAVEEIADAGCIPLT